MRYAAITGWGMAVPERVLTNADLEKMVDTNDEWIVSRTGIRERRIVGPNDSTTSLSVAAATQALERSGISAEELDLIVVATCTPISSHVSQACLVQAELGGKAAALTLARRAPGSSTLLDRVTVHSGRNVRARARDRRRHADAFRRLPDRSTCILFGDGAGAVVLEATDEPRGTLSTVLGAHGEGYKHLYIPGWGAFVPESAGIFPEYRPFLQMNGREVFRFAVTAMGDAAVEAVERAGLQFGDIDMLIPHQANLRIIDAAARRLDLSMDKVWVNLDKYGNTSAASIPIALCEAEAAGKVKDDDNLVFVAFGGGLAWAASVIRWGGIKKAPEHRSPNGVTVEQPIATAIGAE
ncbi:MAG: beta-ketoacyl-ACP synthase III [Thermomicrobiales bacterium]